MYRLHFDSSDNTYCITKGWEEGVKFTWGDYGDTPSETLREFISSLSVHSANEVTILNNDTHTIVYETKSLEELKLYILLGD